MYRGVPDSDSDADMHRGVPNCNAIIDRIAHQDAHADSYWSELSYQDANTDRVANWDGYYTADADRDSYDLLEPVVD